MSQLRLLIKPPGKVQTCIPVLVESTDRIGNCISFLVDRLGFPRRDAQGRALTYALRPLSGGQPLSATIRFADARLLPDTRLMLEIDQTYVATQPFAPSVLGSRAAQIPAARPPLSPSRQIVNRRTFVVGGILTGCAVSGLLTGIGTAFATRPRSLPKTQTLPASSASQMPGTLQQALLFSSHQQTVRALAWFPDGTKIASGADDGLLLLWTLDGQVQQQIPHPTSIAALAWEPTGKRLASGSGTSVRFFDGQTATLLAPARSVHTAQVTSLAWSNAAEHPLVSGSLDKRAIVWETRNYQPQAVFTRHTAAIDALSVPPDGTAVASASQGGVVRVWQVDTLAELHGFYQDAPIPMRAVAFAPTGNTLAVGGNDGQVRIWSHGLVCQRSVGTDQDTLCVDTPLRFRAHTAPVRALSWSPDAHFLATGGEDGTLAIWATSLGQTPTFVTKTTFADPVVAVAWSPVGEQIAVAEGKTVTIWNRTM